MSDELQLGEPVQFYNGDITLRFDKEHWQWYLANGDQLEPVCGVTRISGILDKSLYLIPWACKMMAQKLLRTLPPIGTPIPADLVEIVNAAKTAHKDKLEDATDVGHLAHSWIEASIINALTFNEGVVESMASVKPKDERAISCGEAAFDWMQKHNVRWKSTERKIYSRQHKYAGTLDGLALVDSCTNPICCPHLFMDEESLIDWKSSNYLHIPYLFQTAAYQHAYQEETGVQIKSRWILRLGKEDGKFEPWYETGFAQDFEAFLACLNLYRLNKAIEKRMSDAKKLRTFTKRESKRAKKRNDENPS